MSKRNPELPDQPEAGGNDPGQPGTGPVDDPDRLEAGHLIELLGGTVEQPEDADTELEGVFGSDEDLDGDEAASPAQQDASGDEPWREDPEGFDFRAIRDPAERAKAFARYAAQYPELAMKRDMLWEDYQRKTTEIAQQRRELEELRERLAALEERREEPEAALGGVDPDLEEAAAQLYAWAETFKARAGRDPTLGELAAQAARLHVEPVVEQLAALQQREAEEQRAELAKQERLVMDEWAQVVADYPELASPEVEEEVARVLAGMANASGRIKPGDVRKAALAAYGDVVGGQRVTAARRAQAERASAVPDLTPAGASPTAPGPRSTKLSDVEQYVRRRGIRGLLADMARRR